MSERQKQSRLLKYQEGAVEEDTYKRDRLEDGKGVKRRKFVDMEGGKKKKCRQKEKTAKSLRNNTNEKCEHANQILFSPLNKN